jgi:tetratricopeptide (TPR) repeat protein
MQKTSCSLMAIFVLIMGCNKVGPSEEVRLKEYSERFTEASSPFAEEDVILSTIEYIDNIITQEGNKNIQSIYYNKAGLLYKLKRYDEALAALYQTNDEVYDTYKGALLIRFGRNDEAIPLLYNAIQKNKKELSGALMPDNKKNPIIQGLIALYLLSDIPLELLFVDLINDKIVTRTEADTFLHENVITKEILLNNIWPE